MSKVHYESAKIYQTATEIRQISDEYRNAGNTFVSEIISACNEWDGISKEAFLSFINGSVENQLCNRIPEMLAGVAESMLAIAETFEILDHDIAEKIIYREDN